MKQLRIITVAALLIVFAASELAAQDTLPLELSAAIDKAAGEVLETTGAPSASVAVVRDGRIAYVHAYGLAVLEPPTPATTEMRYSVGSISKQFTAAAALLLAEERKLSLDDKVVRWLPDLTRANEVTLRQLLSMTSGYQDFWPQDYVMPPMLLPTTAQQIMNGWAKIPLDFEPGTKWQYSNTNYVIAGAIVERVSGRPLFEFLQQRIFTKLGMKSVLNTDEVALGPGEPMRYLRYALGPPRPAPKEGKGWMFAAGELAMTARDLALWDISTIDQTILKPASYRAMQTNTLLANGLASGYGLGVQVAIMVGGGNIFRGSRQKQLSIERATGDYMGMLATVINGLALQDALEKLGCHTRLMSAIEMHEVAEPFIRRRATRHLEKDRVVIFAAGTGNPYFSTDTAAALRAMEIKAQVILKATRVDGIYDADPEKVTGAKFFERITYLDVLQKGLSVMDSTAISLCMDNRMPIVVFNMNVQGNLKRVVTGERVGSVVTAA